ncbi:MAG: hypothetical protein DRP78_05650 [Candidatus Omnitrophota bacterium]|nr:MAG: hypothetical protein DRP78_05650 [Candidatus Omnitrophota bacterium]
MQGICKTIAFEYIDRHFVDEPCGVIKMMHYLWRKGYRIGDKIVRSFLRITFHMNKRRNIAYLYFS